jgi:hypothetical protein
LESIRLKEFPFLVKAFGYDGVLELLSSGVMDVHCEAFSIAQIGHTNLSYRKSKGSLPLGEYSFAHVEIANYEKYIHEALQCIHTIPNVSFKKQIKLKKAISARLVRYPKAAKNEILIQTKSDLTENVPNVKTALTNKLQERLQRELRPSDFQFHIARINEEDFRTETNLSEIYGFEKAETHKIVESALLAIAGLNKRIEQMKVFSALSGFRDSDLPIFDEKLKFLEKTLSPDLQRNRLKRVLTISGLPDIERAVLEKKIDLSNLLEIRQSETCRYFREWLWSIDSLSDKELRDRIDSLSQKFSRFVNSKTGKVIRWVAATGLGFVPGIGPLIGTATSAIDSFLLEKLCSSSGAITFCNNMLPSIFKDSGDNN